MSNEVGNQHSDAKLAVVSHKVKQWMTGHEELDTQLSFNTGTIMATKHTTAEPVFQQNDGLLYRIVRKCRMNWMQWRRQECWSYYNDSRDYVMYVTAQFHHICDIEPLGHTTLTLAESGDWIATLIVPPMTEEPFMRGNINGFASRVDAVRVEQAAGRAERDVSYGDSVPANRPQANAVAA